MASARASPGQRPHDERRELRHVVGEVVGEEAADVLEGGTPYPMKAGDTLYVPKNVPHRFVVNPGKYIVYTVVKIAQVD